MRGWSTPPHRPDGGQATTTNVARVQQGRGSLRQGSQPSSGRYHQHLSSRVELRPAIVERRLPRDPNLLSGCCRTSTRCHPGPRTAQRRIALAVLPAVGRRRSPPPRMSSSPTEPTNPSDRRPRSPNPPKSGMWLLQLRHPTGRRQVRPAPGWSQAGAPRKPTPCRLLTVPVGSPRRGFR